LARRGDGDADRGAHQVDARREPALADEVVEHDARQQGEIERRAAVDQGRQLGRTAERDGEPDAARLLEPWRHVLDGGFERIHA